MARAEAALSSEDRAMEEMPGPQEMYLIGIPRSVYAALVQEAGKRNLTFAQLIAAAIDQFLKTTPARGG